MIKINLLPTRELKRQAALRQQLYMALGIVVVVVGVMGWLWWGDTQTIARLEAEKEDLQTKRDRLKKVVDEVTAFERREKLLRSRLEAIQRLRSNQQGPVRMLDELSLGLPEQVWLEALAEKEGVFQVTGYALTNFAVADLVKTLQRSQQFVGADLVSAELAAIEGQAVKKFTVQFRRAGQTGEPTGTPAATKGKPGA